MLHRYAPHARSHFFYQHPPVRPIPPAPFNPSTLAAAAKSGKWLEQARQVMATAEQMRPLIDQYGPLVRNLPSMWKLYRAVQSMPDSDSDSGSPEKKQTTLKKTEPEKTEPIKKTPLRTSESIPWFPGRPS